MILRSDFSWVIASHNEQPEILATTVQALRALGSREVVEIVVVDDASDPPIALDSLPPWTKLIRNETRLGIARSRNVGAESATGDALIFTDAHVAFTENILDVLRSSGVAGGDGIRGCETRLIDGVAGDEVTAKYLGWKLDLAGFPRCWPVTAGAPVDDVWQDVPYVGGCCLAISRKLFDDLGGFASCLVGLGGGGDLELAVRCHALGLPVRSTPAAACYHLTENRFSPLEYHDPVSAYDLERYPGSTANMCRVVMRYLSVALALRKCREAGFTLEQITFICNGDDGAFRSRMETIRPRATVTGEALLAALVAGKSI